MSSHTPRIFKGTSLLLIAGLMYGMYGVFSKLLGSYDIFYHTYVRCLIVTVLLGTYCILKKEVKPIAKEDIKWFVPILLFCCLTIAPIMYAFEYLTLGTTSFLFYASLTVCTYIFGFIFFKEKLTVTKIVSLVCAFIGMLYIFSFDITPGLFFPALMALLNGLASSGEVTLTKKISGKYSTMYISTLVFGIIGVTHMGISLVLGESQDPRLFTYSLPTLFAFILVSITAMVTIVHGFKLMEPSIAAIIGLVEILFGVMFGILFFQEPLTQAVLVGGALILFAAALPNIVELPIFSKDRK